MKSLNFNDSLKNNYNSKKTSYLEFFKAKKS